jgi:hypothetical protein
MAAQRSEHLLTAGSGGLAVCQRRGTRSDGAESEMQHPAGPGDLEGAPLGEADGLILTRPPCRVARRHPDQ